LPSATSIVFDYTDYSIYSIIFIVQLLVYILYSLNEIHNYQSSLEENYSLTENIDLKWMEILLYFYLLHWFFDACFYLYSLLKVSSPDLYLVTGILSALSLLIFSTIMVIMGLKQSTFFNGIEEKKKYSDSTLSDTESDMYITELINYMESSKPYLEPSLKITEIADRLSIPAKSLSQSINQNLNKNFFDFVNSYRVEEAKKRILKSNGNAITILEILYDSGFNSKTAFNRAFKKHTGLTPTQFKSIKTT
jgi:AraC-like DNA-binding protein